ncbi:MAG: Kelch repeat-containing protein [Planctomycetota bacterium]|jgi:N-acetylneuraminic acid mutarotase
MRFFSRIGLLFALLLLLPGCAWFVIGGAAAVFYLQSPEEENVSETVPVVFITAIAGPVSGDVDVEYTLSDAEGNPVDVQVSYSLTGTVFSPATPVAGTLTAGLPSSPSGTVHHFLWDSLTDLGTTPQSTVYLRIIPTDIHGTGAERTEGPFAVDNNGIPVVTNVIPAAPYVENIAVAYTLADPESDAVDVVVEWRAGASGTFLPATEGASGSDGTVGLGASPGGTAHTFVWDSEADTTCTDVSNVEIRITPSDTKQGSSGTSAPILVANNDAPVIEIVTTPTGTVTGTATISYDISDSHSDTSRIEVEFKRESDGADWVVYGQTASPDPPGSTTSTLNITTSPSPGVPHIYPWNSDDAADMYGENGLVRVRIRASDDGGATWGAWTESTNTIDIRNDSAPRIELGAMAPLQQNGLTAIPYTCYDAENHTVSILAEYTDFGGTVWKRATAGPGTTPLNVTPTAGSVSGVFVWDTREDSIFSKNVSFRLTPSEGNLLGIPGNRDFSVGNDTSDPWRAKASMDQSRQEHGVATVNGVIYVIGGVRMPGGIRAWVHAYDQATDTWTWKTNMPTARRDLTCAAVGGKIYAIGGYSTTYLAIVEAYDPATDTWDTNKAPMSGARVNMVSAAVGGKIYVIGGENINPLGTTEVYDPAGNTWTTLTPMPTPRTWAACDSVGDKIYVFGGFDGANEMAVVEVYDTVNDVWSPLPNLPTPRSGTSCSAMGGRLFVMGGFATTQTPVVEAYDPVTHTWATQTPMLFPKTLFASGVSGGKIYAIGGTGSDTSAHAYDPAGEKWTGKAALPTARWGLASESLGGRIYTMGGDNGVYLQTVEQYDPTTNAWSAAASMGTARRSFGSAALGGLIYVVSGRTTGGGDTATVEAFNGNTWSPRAPIPTARRMLSCASAGGKIYAIGGQIGSTSRTGLVEMYDPVSNTWTAKTSMPTARRAPSCVTLGGIIYAIGGYDFSRFATVEAYDPVSDTWTTKTPMPTAREGLECVAQGGRIYAIGGFDGMYIGTVEVYDPAADQWTTRTAMPSGRTGFSSAIHGGRIFTVGGSDAFVVYHNTVESMFLSQVPLVTGKEPMPAPASGGAMISVGGVVFHFGGRTSTANAVSANTASTFAQNFPDSQAFTIDPSWGARAAMGTARRESGTVEYNGTAYVLGGFGTSNNALATFERYDPASDGWTSLTAMTNARGGLGVARIADRLYAFGGDTGLGKTGVLEIYDLQTNTWVTGSFPAMGTPRSHFGFAAFEGRLYAFGGEGMGGAFLNTVERYDPAANTWATINTLPMGLKGALCLYEGGHLKLFGGEIQHPSVSNVMTDQVLVYHHADDTWRREDVVLPYPARDLAGCTVNTTWQQRGQAQGNEFCFLAGGFDGTNRRDGFFRFTTR